MRNVRTRRNRCLTMGKLHFYIGLRTVDMAKKRKFLGVLQCCNVYSRAYMNKEKTAYRGMCPRCDKPIHIKIGQGGTSSRFFNAQ